MREVVEMAFYIIKPEAFDRRQEIIEAILEVDALSIAERKVVLLKSDDIDRLYIDDIDTSLLDAIKTHLVGREVEVGLVRGIEAVELLRDKCGLKPSPLECAPNSIRYRFGKERLILYGGQPYYLNVIHVASRNEIVSSLEWFLKQ